MNREDQPRLQLSHPEGVLAADHRELDDVGGGTLDDGVHSEALAERAHLVVAGTQLGNLPAPAPERLDMTLLLGLRDRVEHELRDLREALEVRVDELLGLLT